MRYNTKESKKPMDKRRIVRRRENKRILLSLLLCFPYGLTRMWKKNCRWWLPLKIGITALFAAAALAVIIFPEPGRERSGNVEMVAMEREVEVFGPELPDNIPAGGYGYVVAESVLTDLGDAQEVTYVYALKGAENYHLSDCRYAYASAQKLTVYQAKFLGYTPCRICRPPEE